MGAVRTDLKSLQKVQTFASGATSRLLQRNLQVKIRVELPTGATGGGARPGLEKKWGNSGPIGKEGPGRGDVKTE